MLFALPSLAILPGVDHGSIFQGSEMTLWIVTVVGPDRPGLVELVADLIAKHQGNWMASRMAHLGGKFAGIIQVYVPEPQREALEKELTELADRGLRVHVEATDQTTAEGAGPVLTQAKQTTLELVGGDRPGIVKEIAGLLAKLGVNVEELSTEYVPAPMSGHDIFRATARLGLPGGMDVEDLQQRVEAVAGDLMVDITLSTQENP
jgi:glycine cleavage system regulatory protein